MNKDGNLMFIFCISMIILLAVTILVVKNPFNFSPSMQSNMVIAIVFIFVIILILMIFSNSTSALFTSFFILFQILLYSSIVIKPNFYNLNNKPLKIYLGFFIITLTTFLISIIIIAVKLRNLKESDLLINLKENKRVNFLLNALVNFFNILIKLIYRARILFPIIAYIVSISIIILTFTIAYESNNYYSIENNLNEGLFFTELGENSSLLRATNFEPLYFSTTIFLNTSDGSIKPVGNTIKLLVQLEMLLAHVMNMIFIPTLLFFYFKIFENKSKTYKNKSKKCIYNSLMLQDSFNNNIRNNRKRRNKKYKAYK